VTATGPTGATDDTGSTGDAGPVGDASPTRDTGSTGDAGSGAPIGDGADEPGHRGDAESTAHEAEERATRTPRPHRRIAAIATAAVAAMSPLLLLLSVLVGGGPKTVSDDIALLVLSARDALHGGVLVGPYSRYGWHHPGPSYFYLLAAPVRLWHGPTGLYVAVALIVAICAAGIALLVRRGAGEGAGWVSAGVASLVVAGVGATTVRNPWNPYVVSFPALLSVVGCALGAAGVPGALLWGAVAGSFAVQTHVSTAPVVGGVFVIAAAARAFPYLVAGARRLLRRAPRGSRRTTSWWRPETVVASVLLVAAWAPPLWDELFRTGNLHSIWRFFTTSHPGHGWGDSWRTVAAVVGATLFQHHAAVGENVPPLHPVAVTILFVALAVAAIGAGVLRSRPVAVWMGALALVAGVLAVVSVTRVVGPTFRYLVVWMAVLPALALIGLGAALAPSRVRWRSLAAAVLAVVVVVPLGLALRSVAQAPAPVSLTDHDIQTAYRLVAPVAGEPGGAVRIEITDGGRWPAAAGVGLELARNGHPIRVAAPWTLLFGENRKATGREPVTVVVAGVDPRTWPPSDQATMLGRAGPEYLFVRRPTG
jgi:hypothetical protein